MPIVTMTTDFGLQDGFVGVMKGVIWGIAPAAQIVDLSHLVAPQNVAQAARLLRRHTPYFPAGSVHLAVVDPGVGTARRALAARLGEQFYVAPDNGLIDPLLQAAIQAGLAVEVVQLDRPEYWLRSVSHTFHGRDIFAPVAAHLAAGVRLAALGSPAANPQRLALPEPVQIPAGWQAQITGIDVFGNLATNLEAHRLPVGRLVRVVVKGTVIDGLSATYGDQTAGALVALTDSEGFLEVAVVNGSAANLLGARVGDMVEVTWR